MDVFDDNEWIFKERENCRLGLKISLYLRKVGLYYPEFPRCMLNVECALV
jgi:hypothetical protein